MKLIFKEGLIAILVIFATQCKSQSLIKVSGRVVDAKGNGLTGVNIYVKGTTRGTVTDSEGRYEISVDPQDSVLVANQIGYRFVEKELKDQRELVFVIETEGPSLHSWCCTDHASPKGPHCGDSKEELTKSFECKYFKPDL